MQHPLSVAYDHQVPAHAGAEANPSKGGRWVLLKIPVMETSMPLGLRLFVCFFRIAPVRRLQGIAARARNQVPPALHCSTQALRVRGHVRVFRCCVRAAGLSVYSHTRMASLRLRLIDVPSLSPSLLSLFSLRRSVNGPSLRRRSSRAAVHALTPGVEPTPGETGRQGQERGGVHRC